MTQTKKIRIGNDIRLAVDLRQYVNVGWLEERKVYTASSPEFEGRDSNIYVNKNTEVYYPGIWGQPGNNGSSSDFAADGTPICIRSVKAFIVNTSKYEDFVNNAKRKSRFISRFPIEPYMECFQSTPYDLCNSGYPTWRAYPHHHLIMPYHGYGVCPDWNRIHKQLPARNLFEYVAPVYATKQQNVVEVSFPAKAQLYTGMYKLIIVAQIYAPGFNVHNLKTVTLDVPDVFELVSTTQEGIDTGVSIKVDNLYDILPSGDDVTTTVIPDDVYVNSGEYSDDNIQLSRTDGSVVDVDVSRVTSWYDGD